MALSGSVSTNKYDARYYELSWTATQSIAKNTSTVEWTLKAKGDAGAWYAERTLKVVLAGQTVLSKTDRVERYDGVVATGSVTLTHDTTGNKSFDVSVDVAIYGTSVNATADETFTLDQIPRYGTSVQSLNAKTETTIKMNWSSDNTVDYLWYSKDNGSNWTGVNVTDGKSGTYTISGLSPNTAYKIKTRIRRKDSQLTTDSSALSVTTYDYPYCTDSPNFILGDELTLKFYNPLKRAFKFYIIGNGTQIDVEYNCSTDTYKGVNSTASSVPYLYATIPNAKSGKYKVKVVYGDSTKTRDNGNTYTIKESVCYPTFTAFTYKDANTTVTNVTGNNQVLVKGLSKLAVEISTANKMVAVNSATPKKYVATIDTLNVPFDYSANAISKEIGVVNTTGTKRLNVTAYDSRNLPKTAYKDITIYDYAKPVINASVKRLNNFEAQTTLEVSGSYSRLTIGGVDKNTLKSVQYRYREVDGTWSGYISLTTTLSSGKFTCNNVVLTLDNTKEFEFEIKVTDNLSNNTASVNVDIGQAIFFVSSNKKTAYLNGVEVTTRDNVRQTKYYTQLAGNTDLNKITGYGTYRSIKQADTDTMANVPAGINGGFTLHVLTWTSNPTDTTYIRQELIYSRWTYIRASNNGGTTWSAWNTTAYLEDLYPVGSVYCNSTNTNPASKFGGTWSLIDKGFKSIHTTVTGGFTPATNITAGETYVNRGGNTLRIRQALVINTALTDTTCELGSFVWNAFGISNIPMSINDAITYRDGANGGIVWSLYSSGKVEQIDIIDATSITSGNTFFLDFTFVVDSSRMLDSVCDKFYWKRTA